MRAQCCPMEVLPKLRRWAKADNNLSPRASPIEGDGQRWARLCRSPRLASEANRSGSWERTVSGNLRPQIRQVFAPALEVHMNIRWCRMAGLLLWFLTSSSAAITCPAVPEPGDTTFPANVAVPASVFPSGPRGWLVALSAV
jgi:hypothetical protein